MTCYNFLWFDCFDGFPDISLLFPVVFQSRKCMQSAPREVSVPPLPVGTGACRWEWTWNPFCVAGWYGLAKAGCCRPTQQCYKILNKHLAFFFATFMLCCISIFGKTPFSPISVTKGDKFGIKRQCRLCSQYLLYTVFVSNSAVLSEFCELGRWIVLDVIISTISAW